MKTIRAAAALLVLICIGFPVAWAIGVQSSSDARSVALPQLDGRTEKSIGAARRVGDLTTFCDQLVGGGALAMAIRMTFFSVESDQGVMQTADGERGVFVELQRSERHVLRLGVNTREGFRRVFIARQTWTGVRDALVVLKGNGSISVTSGSAVVDVTGPELAPDCTNWRIGAGNDLQDFLGTVELSWQFSADSGAFDRMVVDYRGELADAGAESSRWLFVLFLVAAAAMFVVVRSLGYVTNTAHDGN